MGRKSTIKRLAPEVRKHIDKLMREDRHTLDELLEEVRTRFPSEEAPSRSALGRYRLGIEEMAGRMRDIEAGAAALVGELGEDVGDKAGALLVQAVTTLAANAALEAHASEQGATIDEIAKLARASKAAMEARTMSLRERQAVEQAAREKLLAEQDANLKEAARAQGLNDDQVEFWRTKVLGMA